MTSAQQRIGLALSGGGVRAMAFHGGVLRWLAETNRLERVTHLSTVSGGSLLTGLVFKLAGWKWPTSAEYLGTVLPAARKLLTTVSVQSSALQRLLRPTNWRYVLSRANIISQSIEREWGIDARLGDLPKAPDWSANATTAETGKRFRFKQPTCGDYELGYADAADFKVADAMAVSAAFPVGIGPLALRTADYVWHKRDTWGAKPEDAQQVILPYKHIHLYDGGLYDNLGVEPLFDMSAGGFREGVDYIIASDAGAPLERTSPKSILNPFRAKRLIDITMEQVRSLRVRSLVSFLSAEPGRGVYVQMGVEAQKHITKLQEKNPAVAQELLGQVWLDTDEVHRAAAHPTDLKVLRPEEFDRLATHGYQTVKCNERMFQQVTTP